MALMPEKGSKNTILCVGFMPIHQLTIEKIRQSHTHQLRLLFVDDLESMEEGFLAKECHGICLIFINWSAVGVSLQKNIEILRDMKEISHISIVSLVIRGTTKQTQNSPWSMGISLVIEKTSDEEEMHEKLLRAIGLWVPLGDIHCGKEALFLS